MFNFGKGITIKNSVILAPEGGKIQSGSLLDKDGNKALSAKLVKSPFVDVSGSDYFAVPVLWAFYHDPQITTGSDKTHFSPKATCTRAQVVPFQWRANGKPTPDAA